MKKLFLKVTLFAALCAGIPLTSQAAPEMEQEQVTAAQITQVSVNVVRVVNANGEYLRVYNIAGNCIKSFKIEGLDKQYELNLPQGIYIVKAGKTVRRIIIR